MNETNEILVWQDGVPVVTITAEQEFLVWKDNVPVADIDEGNYQPTPTAVRRRAFMF